MVAIGRREKLIKAYNCLRLQQIILTLNLNVKKIQLKRKRLRRWWVKPHIAAQQRNVFGGYNRVCQYLKLHDHEEFYRHFHIGPHNFDRIHELVRERLEKQVSGRPPISSEIRLASVLFPHWLSLAERYINLWNHPNCGGSLDATHVWIIRPPHGGSLFRNYKGFNSIVLMTLSDADRRITWYCLGDYGHLSDLSVYSVSSLCRKLENNQLGFPGPRPLPGTNIVVPHVILADPILPLGKNLMKPYSRQRRLTRREKMYNYRHSRGRMPVECQYGGLQEKWRILQQPLGFDLSVTNDLVTVILALHNYMINSSHPELPTIEPTQPNDEQMAVENYECQLNGSAIRERFADYFSVGGAGYLAWAERRIR
ncbi:hypothetical protein QAD02_002902 [Eretmocerus hayati]|uniref:Uncharacterized protein n=1 Tax=Eretmocerus hayati TaxID=131215 RepID=A0ACC2NLF9_9HYME|nr:hypothetical protein QAD02_002902 [Eretmocerus hayati]